MTVKGTRLLFGDEATKYQDTLSILRSTARSLGFQELIVSSLADQQVFVDKAGPEILKQMYTFKDKGDRDLCLIPEVTAVVQKWFKEHYKGLKNPTKLFYVSRCYRYEKPQSGRYREFTQFGIEVLGDKYTGGSEDLILVLKTLLISAGLSSEKFAVNPLVKRGLSYYTEDGFEVECSHLGAQKQIAGGGRYDCGIGFGIGVERLIIARDGE
jgi:histidyl-tRNA synthetase